MSSNRFALSCALAATTTLLSTHVLAQPKADGFALDRFDPSERGSEWFANESLDLRGNMRLAAGLVLDYANKPLALYEPDGDYRVAIVEHQLFGHVGGALVLSDRFRVGLNLPVAIYQDGRGGTTPDQTFESGNDTTIGDLR